MSNKTLWVIFGVIVIACYFVAGFPLPILPILGGVTGISIRVVLMDVDKFELATVKGGVLLLLFVISVIAMYALSLITFPLKTVGVISALVCGMLIYKIDK